MTQPAPPLLRKAQYKSLPRLALPLLALVYLASFVGLSPWRSAGSDAYGRCLWLKALPSGLARTGDQLVSASAICPLVGNWPVCWLCLCTADLAARPVCLDAGTDFF